MLNSITKFALSAFSISAVLTTLSGSILASADTLPNNCVQPFPDVPCSSPYASWIKDLKDSGVVSGFGDGEFKGEEKVSRGEMSKFVFNGLGWTNNLSCPEFADVNNSYTFYNFTQTLKCEDIIHGYAGNQFISSKTVLRSQATKFVGLSLVEKGNLPRNNVLIRSTTIPYGDVAQSNVYYEYIMMVSKNCNFSPEFGDVYNPNLLYRPNQELTRNEMAMMVSLAKTHITNGETNCNVAVPF